MVFSFPRHAPHDLAGSDQALRAGAGRHLRRHRKTATRRRLASQERDSDRGKRSAMNREILIDVMASLAAAISLLERSPKTAAPSDKMFDQMLADYRKSLETARA